MGALIEITEVRLYKNRYVQTFGIVDKSNNTVIIENLSGEWTTVMRTILSLSTEKTKFYFAGENPSHLLTTISLEQFMDTPNIYLKDPGGSLREIAINTSNLTGFAVSIRSLLHFTDHRKCSRYDLFWDKDRKEYMIGFEKDLVLDLSECLDVIVGRLKKTLGELSRGGE